MVDAGRDADVQLDEIGRQLEDVPEACEPGTGIIDGDPDAQLTQPLKRNTELVVVLDRLVLGEFDDDAPGVGGGQDLDELGRSGGRLGRVHAEIAITQPREICKREPEKCEVERDGQAELGSLAEPSLGRPIRDVEPRERLGAHRCAGLEIEDRLIDHLDARTLDDPVDPRGTFVTIGGGALVSPELSAELLDDARDQPHRHAAFASGRPEDRADDLARVRAFHEIPDGSRAEHLEHRAPVLVR